MNSSFLFNVGVKENAFQLEAVISRQLMIAPSWNAPSFASLLIEFIGNTVEFVRQMQKQLSLRPILPKPLTSIMYFYRQFIYNEL